MLSSRSSQCTVVSIVLSVTVCETVLARTRAEDAKLTWMSQEEEDAQKRNNGHEYIPT